MTQRFVCVLLAALITAAIPALGQGSRVTLTFTPESKTPAFEAASAEYRSIWAAEGARVIEAMERLTTLRFPQRNVKIQVFEGPSNANLLFDRAGVPWDLAIRCASEQATQRTTRRAHSSTNLGTG